MHVNKTNTSVTTTLSLNEPLWPTHSSALSQHTCCQDRRSQRPRGHSGPLWMEEWAKPWTLTNCWPGRTFMSACLHVTSRHPRGCVGSGAELSCIVYPEPGHPPRARVPIILPCHGHCSASLDALRRHSRTVRSCGRNILPLIQEKTTLELVKHGPASPSGPLLLG